MTKQEELAHLNEELARCRRESDILGFREACEKIKKLEEN